MILWNIFEREIARVALDMQKVHELCNELYFVREIIFILYL